MHSLSLLSLVLAFTSLASGAAISNWHGPTQGWSSVVARAPSGASLRSRRLISLMQLDEGQTEFISKTSDGVRRSIVPQKFNLHSGSVPFITYGVGKRSMITEPFSHHDWNTLNGPITKRDVVSAGVGKRSMITQPFSHHDWNAVSGSITKRGIIAPPAGNHFVGWKGVGIVARDDLEARSIMPPSQVLISCGEGLQTPLLGSWSGRI